LIAGLSVLVGGCYRQAGGPQTQAAAFGVAAVPERASLLNQYCVTCHNERLNTAGLALDIADVTAVGEAAQLWEKVAVKLRADAMPPPGMPRPAEAARRAFVTRLEADLDRAANANPNPGRPGTFHRLNRTEYQNAIRDLLALEVDVTAWLPGDDAAYGFDNNADVLSMSPVLLDGYLSAASKVSRLAVGDMSASPEISTYTFSTFLLQEDRVGEDLPFGSRGGAAVRHYFPLDGEYGITIRLQGPRSESERVEVRLDGVRVVDAPPELNRAEADQSDGTAEHGVVQVRITAEAGSHVVGIVLLKRMFAAEGQFPEYYPWGNSGVFSTVTGARQLLHVDGIEITGPFAPTGVGDTPSRRRIFVCSPTSRADEEPCATEILGTLARGAYRRPVTDADLGILMGFYRNAREERDDFEGGIRAAVNRMLVDPDFLYRVEMDPPGSPGMPYQLTDLELASRLSFFLWSSIPDEELLTLAAQNALGDPVVLEQQVRRMLADERSKALVTNFAAQWLYLRNVEMVAPDLFQFPDWDDNLRQAMAQETELFLGSQLREDRGVPELLTADYTFVNERLARHYGMTDVYGNRFRRVTLPEHRRVGLLGHASILTVTSYANRTSPVLRGKWLLENVLGAPPPAPPPDVPDLPEIERGEEPSSVRERLEQHRQNPTCASCHAVIDPLGFALEPFDAIGRWRTHDGGHPVDAMGSLPNGTSIDGPVGLRDLLVGRQEEFVRTVTEKLLIYAIGRGVEYYDMPMVRQIMREAASADYHWSAIILGITKSSPFQMRTRRGE
jgi:hypothetical protein